MNSNNVYGPQASRPLILVFALLFALAPNDVYPASFQSVLNQKLGDQNSSALIISARTGNVLGATHADRIEKPSPPGSLIKVFTAIAFYEQHGNHFPEFRCPATLSSDPNGCWDRNGHGKVGIVEGLAHSCNVYFRQLAQQISPQIFRKTLQKFDLAQVEASLDPQGIMTGKTLDWTVSPKLLLRAYCALFNGGYLFEAPDHAARHVVLEEPIKKLLHQGMKLSSDQGTSLEAKRISRQTILGKTGTSLLWKDGKVNWHDTQGWWIGLYPADKPEIAVLTFVPHGKGATHAAPLGGKIISWFLQTR
jgi:cell division protein FtsI/penicillin-binding protein 2